MLSLVFLYGFNFDLLVFMSSANYIIEKKFKKNNYDDDESDDDIDMFIFHQKLHLEDLKEHESYLRTFVTKSIR